MQKTLENSIARLVQVVARSRLGGKLIDLLLSQAMEATQSVEHGKVNLRFSTPNRLNRWRIDTFATKEPETLEWIDSIPDGAILWDVGANVGLYACYAATARNCKVFAFEPSVFNLELLARNVYLNELTQNVTIIPLPLAESRTESSLRLTTTEWGGALSTFGKEFGWDGKPIQPVFEFKTVGVSLDEARTTLGLPLPHFIKMDVDGLEHFILTGGDKVLASVQGILIEVNDDFHEQATACKSILENAGLTLKEKRHSELIALSQTGFANSYNQIWIRA